MPIRLAAFANLASELSQMTVSMGGLLVRSARRPRTTYYEDHF